MIGLALFEDAIEVGQRVLWSLAVSVRTGPGMFCEKERSFRVHCNSSAGGDVAVDGGEPQCNDRENPQKHQCERVVRQDGNQGGEKHVEEGSTVDEVSNADVPEVVESTRIAPRRNGPPMWSGPVCRGSNS